MENKMISVIIPNYNGSPFLMKCLMSVENQTYKNIEIIIIDDGSTDNSCEIIEEFKRQSKRNVKTLFQNNQNGAIARNNGLSISNGEYIFFLDSDDILYEDGVFEYIINEISDYDLLISDYEIINENDEIVKRYVADKNILDIDNLYKYSRISPVPSNKFFLKKIIDENEIYFSNVRIGQDLNFYLKYLSCSKKIKICSKPFYKYRIVSNSMTRKNDLNFMDIYYSIKGVQNYYYNHNKRDEFNFYIANVTLEHIQQQFSKCKNIRERKTKKMLRLYFDICFKELTNVSTNKNSYYYKQQKYFYIKKILIAFRLYNLVERIIR